MSTGKFKTQIECKDNGYPLLVNVKVMFSDWKEYRNGYITKNAYGYNFNFIDPITKQNTIYCLTPCEKVMYNGEIWNRYS